MPIQNHQNCTKSSPFLSCNTIRKMKHAMRKQQRDLLKDPRMQYLCNLYLNKGGKDE